MNGPQAEEILKRKLSDSEIQDLALKAAKEIEHQRAKFRNELFTLLSLDSPSDKKLINQIASDVYRHDSQLAGELVLAVKIHNRKK